MEAFAQVLQVLQGENWAGAKRTQSVRTLLMAGTKTPCSHGARHIAGAQQKLVNEGINEQMKREEILQHLGCEE